MIQREVSAWFVNAVVNDPSVKPWVSGQIEGRLDLKEPILDGRCIALFGEHGGFMFWHLGFGIYDAHSAVLPIGRGRWALKAAREALDYMFANGAREVMMSVPHGNDAVRGLVRLLGAHKRGCVEDAWWLDGHQVDVDVYSLTHSDWKPCQ